MRKPKLKLKSARIWLAIAVLAVSAAVGFAWSQPYAPERLRVELEGRLTGLLGGEVRIPELRLALGWGLRLVGRNVEAWPGSDGAALHVDRVTAELRPFAILTGQQHLRLLRVEGVRLRTVRQPDGAWSPPFAEALLGETPDRPDGQPAHPDEWLQPVVRLEALARRLLAASPIADTVELRGGELRIEGEPGLAAFEDLHGRFRHRWWDEAELHLQGVLRDGSGASGRFELEGNHGRKGQLDVALALSELDLTILRPWLRELRADARLAGRLTGAVAFAAPEPGQARLEIDLVASGIESSVPAPELAPAERRIPRFQLAGTLAVSPQQVRVEALNLATDPFSMEIDGSLGRPLRSESPAELALTIRGASLTHLRHLIGWLPEVRREEAEGIVRPLEEGSIAMLRVGGADTLSGWQAFLAGRSARMPEGFVIDARLEETTLRVGETDRLDDLSGRLWWTGDRLEIRDATGRLNGNPLPRLDMGLEGISHLFATDPAARRLRPGADALPGLATLWEAVADDPGDKPAAISPIQLDVERLDHPIFLWPLENVSARIEMVEGGFHVVATGGTLGGASLSGKVEWIFKPERHVRGRLEVGEPGPREVATPEPGPWLQSRFAMEGMEAGPWTHRRAQGELVGDGAALEVIGAEVELEPEGTLRGNARFDLAREETVPLLLELELSDGDAASVGALFGLPPELVAGHVDASVALGGALTPRSADASFAETLAGRVSIDARSGTISRAVPAVVAVALASDMVNPFARRERARYERITTVLEFDDGVLHSDELALEGPDVRAIASGDVDIARDAHPVDVEVVLFLFRPVDSVLEKIPVVNFILLGENENLIAAHYALKGTWDDPKVHMIPHRSLTAGPGSLVFERLPGLVRRGFEALDSLLSGGRVADQGRAEPAPAPTGG